MEDSKGKALVRKYLKGECSPSEKAIIEKWYIGLAQQDSDEIAEPDYEKIEAEIWNRLPQQAAEKEKIRKLWPSYAAAAVVVLLLLSVTVYFINKKTVDFSNSIALTNEIKPGGNKATLTLSDGSIVVLDEQNNGIITNHDKAKIKKVKEGVLSYSGNNQNDVVSVVNTLSTPQGGTYQIELPDGTRVWLNSGTSLKYPTKFTGKERLVELTGEAYFEVAHNKEKPFKVISDKQTVQVLGTHFNINAYSDEEAIKTTLLEGSIKISRGHNFQLVKPGQQAIVSNNEEIKLKTVNTEGVIAWKNGYFNFENARLDVIMRELARWYDVKVIYRGNISDATFSGAIERSLPLNKVLEKFETNTTHFKIEGKEVVISQ